MTWAMSKSKSNQLSVDAQTCTTSFNSAISPGLKSIVLSSLILMCWITWEPENPFFCNWSRISALSENQVQKSSIVFFWPGWRVEGRSIGVLAWDSRRGTGKTGGQNSPKSSGGKLIWLWISWAAFTSALSWRQHWRSGDLAATVWGSRVSNRALFGGMSIIAYWGPLSFKSNQHWKWKWKLNENSQLWLPSSQAHKIPGGNDLLNLVAQSNVHFHTFLHLSDISTLLAANLSGYS